MTAAEPLPPAPPAGARRKRRRVPTWSALLLWFVAMAPLSFWGLPGSSRDDLLFGGQAPWSPDQYQVAAALDARRTRTGGADTDLDPLRADERIVDLTAADAGRAEILRRYRLYSRQPDEMITFMALQRMKPPHSLWDLLRGRFDFDPRLYQYGGGYIYLVGAALGASSALGLSRLTTDANVYLAAPELFARFYLVARFISLVFGALALLAVIQLARRAAGRTAGWIAFLFVAFSPLFITAVLEAKPHLPSVCLTLWAVLAAWDWLTRPAWRATVRMGLQAGYAFGLALTGLFSAAIALVLPFVTRMDRRRWRQLAFAVGLAALVYLVTNPYIPYNALFRRDVLFSNVANSTAMYSVGRFPQGAARVASLLSESCGIGVLVAGLIGLVLLFRRRPRETAIAAAPGLVTLLVAVAIDAGKPAEFARFLLLPVVLLCVASAYAVARLGARSTTSGMLATAVILALMQTYSYVRSFATDAYRVDETRWAAGRFLRERMRPNDILGVIQEPAPYAIPPLDFAHRRVLLLPPRKLEPATAAALPDWLVATADDHSRLRLHEAWWSPHYELVCRFPDHGDWPSRISWANKPVFIFQRR